MKFKCRLRVILAERDIKHQDFAEKIGVSKSTMSSLINSKQVPTFEVAYRIIEETGMRIEEIWMKEE